MSGEGPAGTTGATGAAWVVAGDGDAEADARPASTPPATPAARATPNATEEVQRFISTRRPRTWPDRGTGSRSKCRCCPPPADEGVALSRPENVRPPACRR